MPNCFLKSLCQFIVPPAILSPMDPHPLQTLEITRLSKFWAKHTSVKRYLIVALIHISIITKDNYFHFTCSLAIGISSPRRFKVSI